VPIEKKPPTPRASQKKKPPGEPGGVPARIPLTAGRAATAAGSAGAGSAASVSGRPASRKPPGTRPAPKPAGAKAAALKPAAAHRTLKSVVLEALDDMKALEVKVLDVRGLTDIADYMVIASGTSDRHVRSVAQRVVEKTKQAGFRPHGVEGQQDGDWVLIDLHEYIVHVMLPRVREFYGLEKLWDMTAKRAVRA
jgi:ribosome-associated protein